MMTLKFALRDSVKIKPLEGWAGVVTGIWIAGKGVQYQVRYFHEGKAEEVYFYEDELE